MDTPGIITEKETRLALTCIDTALGCGAGQVRVVLNKSTLDSYNLLNGELEKVTRSADRSIMLYIFADGRYGTFSTNMLDEASLAEFTAQAVESVRMLSEDPFRKLPEPERTEKGAVTGRELGLYDETYGKLTAEEKLRIAEKECIFGNTGIRDGVRLVSEECEYSDSVDDCFTADSSGFRGRHTETSFALCSEITVETADGKKYSGYWWDSSPFLAGLATGKCSEKAYANACRQINPVHTGSGRYNMVVDRTVSSRLVSPLFSALNSSAIQQESSFLAGSLGRKIFSDGLTVTDRARSFGKPGARLFDSEGVATKDMDIIRCGEVRTYFTNTYMALKMGMEPTVEGVSRPVLLPFGNDARLQECHGGCGDGSRFGADEMMRLCGSGIYVTGFNGGNCNPVTGDFSYGIEGFVFENGEILHPVREMVITGNMTALWRSLLYAGDDARACTRWQIPSVAFAGVDFSG